MTKWEKVELGSVCEVVRGGSPRPIIDYITEEEDGVNWLKIGDVKETDKYFIHAAERIKPSGIPKTREVKSGDLILSNSMSFGRAFITLIDGYIHDGWLRLRVNENKLDKEYLYYFLTSSMAQNQFKAVATGSVVNNLKSDTVKAVQIALPSLNEQKRIADVLNMFDEKIKNNEAVNDNLYEQVATYYKHLFAGITSTTSVGEMADNIFSGGTPSTANEAYWNGDHYWLSSGETSNRFIVSTIKTITEEGITNSSTRKANKYDIAIASAGQGHTRGQTSMLLTETYVNQSIIVVHANGDYLPFLFWNIANRYEELRVISNSNSIRGSLTTKMISSLNIPKTDAARIKQFSDYAWPIIKTIENNLNENQKLTAIRDIVLPKLMSGELDVSNIDI